MNHGRRQGLDCKVNLLVQYGKQLARSFLLLAHYTTMFVSFASRSVGWFVEAIRWTVLSVQCIASVFNAAHGVLSRLSRRCAGAALEVLSGKDSDSE